MKSVSFVAWGISCLIGYAMWKITVITTIKLTTKLTIKQTIKPITKHPSVNSPCARPRILAYRSASHATFMHMLTNKDAVNK